jgi:hypothetical protein
MNLQNAEYTRIGVRVKTDKYIEFKKSLLDERTTPTAAINRFIEDHLQKTSKEKREN